MEVPDVFASKTEELKPFYEALLAVAFLIGFIVYAIIPLLGPVFFLAYFHYDEGIQCLGALCGLLFQAWFAEYSARKWPWLLPNI